MQGNFGGVVMDGQKIEPLLGGYLKKKNQSSDPWLGKFSKNQNWQLSDTEICKKLRPIGSLKIQITTWQWGDIEIWVIFLIGNLIKM